MTTDYKHGDLHGPGASDVEVAETKTVAAVGLTDDGVTVATPPEPEVALKNRFSAAGVTAFVVLPIVTLLLAVAAGYLQWEYTSHRSADKAGSESVQAAKDSTVALLSYKPETVDTELSAARDRLTGSFLDAYTQLVNTVVIPGAKEKKISALAVVPAAASISANADHAAVLLFVDQTITIGAEAPTNTAATVRVTLDNVEGRWLISGFDPI